ncbi:MAG: hypothetical protein JSV25_04035, partial [Spirochaetota bacterium]
AVECVLKEIDADSLPVLYVFNKVDLLPQRNTKALILGRYQTSVLVSAKTKEGIEDLKKELLAYYKAEKTKSKRHKEEGKRITISNP